VGKIDGVIGAGTRAAVKAVQQQLGLPADSYPDAAFLAALRKM
jgi:peptidoglycan hydrolase-like protein with peptidoglycan-binding domain